MSATESSYDLAIFSRPAALTAGCNVSTFNHSHFQFESNYMSFVTLLSAVTALVFFVSSISLQGVINIHLMCGESIAALLSGVSIPWSDYVLLRSSRNFHSFLVKKYKYSFKRFLDYIRKSAKPAGRYETLVRRNVHRNTLN